MVFPKLKDLRVDHDMTQKEVAKVLHCRRDVYARYECGMRELPLSYAIILARFYGVTVDYLVSSPSSS